MTIENTVSSINLEAHGTYKLTDKERNDIIQQKRGMIQADLNMIQYLQARVSVLQRDIQLLMGVMPK